MPDHQSADRARKTEILAGMSLFESCTKRELEQVATVSVDAVLRAGTILTHQGQVGGLVYVIVEGEASVSSGGAHIGTIGPGDVAGELSLIDGQPRSAEVKAITDVRVLEINSDDFQALMAKTPHFVQNLMRALASRIRDADSHGEP